MKILLAVDGSAYSKKMLAYLVTHDSMFTASNEYTALTVPVALPPRARAAVGKAIVEKCYADEVEKVIAPIDKFLQRHGIGAKSMWKAGSPGEVISKVATEGKYDLVIMGSHGNGAVLSLVMGSVATQVLAHCKVPVLLVR